MSQIAAGPMDASRNCCSHAPLGRLSLDTRIANGAQRRRYSSLTFNDLTIASAPRFLPLSKVMRLLAEILIIGALIYFGWNKPFKEYVAQANTTITTKLH